MSERYVVLGLAAPRAAWFGAVGRWSTTGALPVEFVKAVSADEVRARLEAGRPYSAVLLDGGLPAVDRDLVEVARAAGAAVLVVDDGRVRRPWVALGASAVLGADLAREELLDALATHARPLARGSAAGPTGLEELAPVVPGWGAPVAVVCGPGGTGASTVAMALAQGLADDGLDPVLVDGCRRAQLAMLHDVGDVAPGLQDLVEQHRHGRPGRDELAAATFPIEAREYRLLLGLRRTRHWTLLRRRAFEATVDTLQQGFGAVVADVDADLEGEATTGSFDVEERNLVARTLASRADVVFVVGRPGLKGVHSLAWVVHELVELGVEPERVVPVFNQVPRAPRLRSTCARALAGLLEELAPTAPALFLPHRRVDPALDDATRLPAPLPELLARTFGAVRERVGGRRLWTAGDDPSEGATGGSAPVAVRPGELGLAGTDPGDDGPGWAAGPPAAEA